jgi:NADH-quinone oxidoreductase subunit J
MLLLFYIAAVIAVLATGLALSRLHAVHALLYLIVSLLAVAIIFYLFGAPFIAALELIIYAGAIMVLFIFVVMLLNLGPQTIAMERDWLRRGVWTGPVLLAAVLLAEVMYMLWRTNGADTGTGMVGPKEVGMALYGPYLIGVELASFLLMAGLVGAYHLGRRSSERREVDYGADSDGSRSATGGNLVRAGAGRTSRSAQPDLHPDGD